MTEKLSNLPEELKAKVFRFQRHPVAELFVQRTEAREKLAREHLEALQELFPHLTEEDMYRKKAGDNFPGMCMLYVMMFEYS